MLKEFEELCKIARVITDLEKAASSACRHFVRNHAILRKVKVKYPKLLTENGGRIVENG